MTPQQRKRVIVAALVLALIVSVICLDWRALLRNDYHRIMQKGRLTWIADDGPWGFDAHKRDSMGFHYELLKAYADSMGLELEVKVINGRKEQLKALKKGEGSLLAADVLHTERMCREYRCLHPLYVTRMCVVQHTLSDKKIVDAAQLKDSRVVVPSEDAYQLRLQHLMEELACDIEVVMSAQDAERDVLLKVEKNVCAYGLCLEKHGKKWKKEFPMLDFSVGVGVEQPCGWVVHKDAEDLAKSLDSFLRRFVTTADYRKIYSKYF